MQFSNEVLMRVGIFILALCGFFVAKHIRNHKTKNTPLVCPIGFDCHTVVHSDYSKFLGMPVEFLGMVYYSIAVVISLVFIFMPNIMSDSISLFFSIMSLLAFIFSAYLIFIQIFVIKKGCSWCIVSAMLSAFIFILTLFS